MSLKIVFNPFTGKFDFVNASTATAIIPEFDSDPVSPTPEEAWVLHTGGSVAGEPMGLLLSLTYATNQVGGYQLSYRTTEGTTVRVPLT